MAIVNCPTCHGKGYVYEIDADTLPIKAIKVTCPTCNGKKVIFKK